MRSAPPPSDKCKTFALLLFCFWGGGRCPPFLTQALSCCSDRHVASTEHRILRFTEARAVGSREKGDGAHRHAGPHPLGAWSAQDPIWQDHEEDPAQDLSWPDLQGGVGRSVFFFKYIYIYCCPHNILINILINVVCIFFFLSFFFFGLCLPDITTLADPSVVEQLIELKGK